MRILNMKVAYVTTYDSSDVYQWSGLGDYIFKALQDVGIETESIGNLKEVNIWWLLSRFKQSYYSKLRSKKYLRDREPEILKNYAAQVNKTLGTVNSDIVFSPGTVPIAYLQTEKPIIFWSDSTFAGMIFTQNLPTYALKP
jgi:hypothetical protein